MLQSLLIFEALFLARSDLVDQNLGTALTSISCTLLTLKLGLNSLQSLNLHHQIQSLLLLDPILFKLLVLVELTLANGPDLGSKRHLVHMFHIIVVLVHLLLSTSQERVLAESCH